METSDKIGMVHIYREMTRKNSASVLKIRYSIFFLSQSFMSGVKQNARTQSNFFIYKNIKILLWHKISLKFFYFISNNDFRCQNLIFILNWYFQWNIDLHCWLNSKKYGVISLDIEQLDNFSLKLTVPHWELIGKDYNFSDYVSYCIL